MLMGHRIALDPNNAQSAHLFRAAGTARFAYNWALSEWKRQYERGRATILCRSRRSSDRCELRTTNK